MKISKLNLSNLIKSCGHALSPSEKMLFFFVAFCDNGDRQRKPWDFSNKSFKIFSEMAGLSLR